MSFFVNLMVTKGIYTLSTKNRSELLAFWQTIKKRVLLPKKRLFLFKNIHYICITSSLTICYERSHDANEIK